MIDEEKICYMFKYILIGDVGKYNIFPIKKNKYKIKFYYLTL